MDAQLKAKWVEALRSGEYKQGQGILHSKSGDSYCCLGVLCKVMGAEFGPVIEGFYKELDYVPHIGDKILSDGDAEELNAELVQEMDIPQATLIQMNDGFSDDHFSPKSFAEIADFIEKNL